MTTPPGNDDSALARARALLEEGQLDAALSALREHWLKHPADSEAAMLLSKLMSEAGKPDLSTKLQKLSESLSGGSEGASSSTSSSSSQSSSPNSAAVPKAASGGSASPPPQDLFEAGFGLIDVRQHELAAMLLKQCASMVPEEPVVNYELGFSLMSLGRFMQAIPYFERAQRAHEDFDTCLNLAVCHTMCRNMQKASTLLGKLDALATNEEERQELAHRKIVLRRLEGFAGRSNLTVREWLYILYGAILLRTIDRFVPEDATSVAAMLAVLKGVLEGLRVDIEVVEYYSLKSKPLAGVLGELMEIPTDSYRGPDRPDRALLLINWAGDLIGPHRALTANTDQRILFSYGMPVEEPLPLVTELVGALVEESAMPWTKGDSEQVLASILEKARDLESDPEIIKSVQTLVDFFSEHKSLTLLQNPKAFPQRPEYTAEIPPEATQ